MSQLNCDRCRAAGRYQRHPPPAPEVPHPAPAAFRASESSSREPVERLEGAYGIQFYQLGAAPRQTVIAKSLPYFMVGIPPVFRNIGRFHGNHHIYNFLVVKYFRYARKSLAFPFRFLHPEHLLEFPDRHRLLPEQDRREIVELRPVRPEHPERAGELRLERLLHERVYLPGFVLAVIARDRGIHSEKDRSE